MHTETFGGEELFLVEGNLTALKTSRTTQNLLEQIEKNFQAKNLAGGIAAAASDMYGMVANAATLAFYDGENTYNFAAMMGKRVICGSFSDADKLSEGDAIKAVVSIRGDVLYAHSVVRKENQLLMLPQMVVTGRKAFFRHCMKVAAWMSISGVCFFSVMTYFIGASLGFLFAFSAPLPVMAILFETWNYRSMRNYGYYASTIFRLLGVPRPDDFDSRSGTHYYPEKYFGTNFELALSKHKAKFGIKD